MIVGVTVKTGGTSGQNSDRLMPEHVVEFGRVGRAPEPDGRLDAPAFHRNHAAIWSVLEPFLAGRNGHVLEVGSGTGQHAAAFAGLTPDMTWWPSDTNDKHLASIAAWRAHANLANLREAARVDLLDRDWASERRGLDGPFVAILCINVLHISPWQASVNLLAGAARCLTPDGRLLVYGPFMKGGEHTAPSNAEFDAGLRRDNPAWGVRDIDQMRASANDAGLRLAEAVAMPANNFTLVFERADRGTFTPT
jgi:SAM-dependent methyltransferase